jgi:MFS family permease
VSVLALWPSAPRAQFIAFVVAYGVLAGGYNALLPTTIAEVYGVQHYTSVNSIIYFIRGLGALFGAPLAGVILGSHQRGLGLHPQGSASSVQDVAVLRTKYNMVAVYDGCLLLAAGLCVLYVRWSDARYRGRWQWKA